VLFFGSIFPLFFITQGVLTDWLKIKKVAIALTAGGAIVSLVGLFQYLLQFFASFEQIYNFWGKYIMPLFLGNNLANMILVYPSWFVETGIEENMMRAFSIYGDPHMLAFFLGILLPLGLALYFTSTKKYRWLILAADILMYVVLLLTFTRGAYMAIAGSFVVLAILLWQKFKLKKEAIIIMLSLLVFVIPGTSVAYRFYSIFNTEEPSNLGRIEMWQQASRLGSQNLITGVGLGNYSVEIKPELGYRNPATAHNLYLDIFSEMGIIALIFWVLLILGTIWLVYKKIKILPINAPVIWIYLGLIGSLIYYALHSIFETAIYQPVILAILMVLLALAYAKQPRKT
jgi:O-antigen ligase